MYLEIFLADFAVFRVFWGISRDFAEIPEFRGSMTARNIRSPVIMSAILLYLLHNVSSFLPVYISSDKYMITIFASGHNNIMVI